MTIISYNACLAISVEIYAIYQFWSNNSQFFMTMKFPKQADKNKINPKQSTTSISNISKQENYPNNIETFVSDIVSV